MGIKDTLLAVIVLIGSQKKGGGADLMQVLFQPSQIDLDKGKTPHRKVDAVVEAQSTRGMCLFNGFSWIG